VDEIIPRGSFTRWSRAGLGGSPTGIDAGAPVRGHQEIDIDAPLSAVRELHTDVNSWPAWQTETTAAHLDGAVPAGT
jgi:hypothetical protein